MAVLAGGTEPAGAESDRRGALGQDKKEEKERKETKPEIPVHTHAAGEEGPDHAAFDAELAEKARAYRAFVAPAKLLAAQAPQDLARLGMWNSVETWPFVIASAASLPDGRIIAWGGNNPRSFSGGNNTLAAVWDPVARQITSINHNDHSMFCGIPVMLEDGRVLVNGGDGTRERVSTFDYRSNSWRRVEDMNAARWYPGSVALPSGQVFTVLGEPGGIYPEIWTEGQGWSLLTGSNVQAPILNFPGFQRNWLPYVYLSPNGMIFHLGPTQQMNWFNPTGNGAISNAGTSNIWYPKYSAAVMYDAGKVLVAGGMMNNNAQNSTNQAMIVDFSAATPAVALTNPMTYARKFNNGVVLPTGEVMMVGGNSSGIEFSDQGTILTPEIWNPQTQTWRVAADMSVPRNYHSVALLMTDGRVWAGGGGLCNCAADHPDHQIYTPPYLYNPDGTLAARPTISSAPNYTTVRQSFEVQGSTNIQRFSFIKMSGITHNLNSDLRFLNIPFTTTASGRYQLTMPDNLNVLTPGYWMLFAINTHGVPSVAKVMQVFSSGKPTIVPVNNQNYVVGASVNLAVSATDPNGDPFTFSATGLPPGASIDASTGLLTGMLTTTGLYTPVITVRDNRGDSSSVSIVWAVRNPGTAPGLEYDYYEGAWSALPNFDGLTPVKKGVIPTFDLSVRNRGENFGIRFQGKISIGMAGSYTFFTNSDDGSQLKIDGNLIVDNDGLHAVRERSGTATLGSGEHSIEVTFFEATGGERLGVSYAGPGIAKRAIPAEALYYTPPAPILVSNPSARSNAVNAPVSLQIQATGGAAALRYSATGLPTGLAINATTGLISGTPTTVGGFNPTVTVQDGRVSPASVSFSWTIQPPALAINTMSSAPRPANTNITYTASVTNGVNPRYKWLFGDGTAETTYSTSASITKAFTQPGIYVVRVTSTDDRGVEQSTTFVQAIHMPLTANRPAVSMNIAFEDRATANDRVWIVNQDNNTVSVFDSVTNAKAAEIAVGAMPRAVAVAPNGRIWVTNKGAATISIIDPGTLGVVQTVSLPFGSQPFGLAFSPAGGSAFVTLEATGGLLKLDAATGAQTGSLNLGQHIRHLSVSGDGTRVYVSRFITPPVPGECTSFPNVAVGGGQVIAVNPATMTTVQTIRLLHSDRPDTENSGRGIPNYLGPAVISPDGRTAWVPSKQDNLLRGTLRDGRNLTFDSAVRSITSRIDLTTGVENPEDRIDHNNAGIASSGIFDRFGVYLFVAIEGSREVIVVDAYGKRELFRVDVGFAPQGLALSADGLRLYVNNYMDRTVTVLNIANLINRGIPAAPVLATYNAVATEALAAQVLRGKQLYYDSRDRRLAMDAYVSCAACHNDGGHDGRVWDFTGFGEGLRNTIALQGRAGGQGFQHWSGNFDEIHDFEGQIRNFAGGLGLMTDAQYNQGTCHQPLGDPKAGVSADLDALAAYVFSLNAFAPSPYRNADGTLTTDAAAGRMLYINRNCASCHGGAGFTNSGAGNLVNIGTIKASSGGRLGGALTGIDTPTLRDVWATAPYLHDGSAATLGEAIRAHNGVTIGDADLAKLVAFMQQIGSQEAAISVQEIAAINQPPTISLTAPAAGTALVSPATITITANAADADGTVSRVEFYNGATLLGTDTSAPYSFAWMSVAAGSYSLTARAVDNADAATTSTAVSITVAAPGANGLRAEYFNNANLTESVLTRTDATVNFDWGTASPAASIGAETFSVRWSGQVQPQFSQLYTFYVTADDGVRLWVNGQLLINDWADRPPTERSGTIALQANQRYNIVLEYYENFGGAVARLSWSSPSQPKQIIPQTNLHPMTASETVVSGLLGEYFNNNNFTAPVLTRTDATVNFDWGTASPAASIGAETFSVRWSGQVQPQFSQLYTFYVTADDGVRLWVNGQLLINDWADRPPTERSGTIALQANQRYNIVLEYYENFGGAVARLSWSSPSQPKQIIPQANLFNTTPAPSLVRLGDLTPITAVK